MYRVSVTDLEFFKRQQWSVTNYALLFCAAMVSVMRLLGDDVVRKARLAMIRKNFLTGFHEAGPAREKVEEKFGIFPPLLALIVIGVAAVGWLAYVRL